jgi:hypothetical protein
VDPKRTTVEELESRVYMGKEILMRAMIAETGCDINDLHPVTVNTEHGWTFHCEILEVEWGCISKNSALALDLKASEEEMFKRIDMRKNIVEDFQEHYHVPPSEAELFVETEGEKVNIGIRRRTV